MKTRKNQTREKLLGLWDRLNFLFQVKLVNIRNDDITDGNPKLTLGLIWTIILHFQVRSRVLVTQFVHGLETLCCLLQTEFASLLYVWLTMMGSNWKGELKWAWKHDAVSLAPSVIIFGIFLLWFGLVPRSLELEVCLVMSNLGSLGSQHEG